MIPAGSTGDVAFRRLMVRGVIMRNRRLSASLPGLLCLMAAQHAWGDSMRCGNRLIQGGESMAAVRALCGSPTDVQHGFLAKGSTVRSGDAGRTTVAVEIPVETWTYDRGPNELMVSIRFADGKVAAVETLHQYGH
jgi:hypothetical protein